MKKLYLIFPLLLVPILLFAQQREVILTVKKKPVLTIVPDSMYFQSRESRCFALSGVPAGWTISGDFLGYPFYVVDSVSRVWSDWPWADRDHSIGPDSIILNPLVVYRFSDLKKFNGWEAKVGSEKISGLSVERITDGDVYAGLLHINLYDTEGILRDSLVRTCFVSPAPMSFLVQQDTTWWEPSTAMMSAPQSKAQKLKNKLSEANKRQ